MPPGIYERKPKPVSERYFRKIVRRENGCWEWTGSTTTVGYGQIRISGRGVPTHRYSWELHNGPIPSHLCVLHKCDNRLCSNPEHLFLGTKLDNTRDMIQKKRAKLGEELPQSKLTKQIVLEIRAARGIISQERLAKKYGISPCHVSYIQTRKSWKHI